MENEMAKLSTVAAVERLARIERMLASDPEAAHSDADAVLLACVPVAVRDAYQRVVDACSWWATA
jgi:hypothetical protein